MQTRSGSFPIGFRRGWSQWQKNLPDVVAWAKQNQFDAMDLGVGTDADLVTLNAAGLKLGTVDLMQMGDITHSDDGKRKEIIAANIEYVKKFAGLGAKIFFSVVGGDATKKRAENYKLAVESFAPIAEAAASAGATIAVEGYPGGPPHFTMICTTPETCRAFFKEIPRGMALNYDPSHLIRLGVDHIRFLKEFAGNVAHVHGKDTELFPEAQYELGIYQPSAFTIPHGFGEQIWRYTTPGQGVARWTEIFKTLVGVSYKGMVCIELEDENFNGSEPGEKAGLICGMQCLAGA